MHECQISDVTFGLTGYHQSNCILLSIHAITEFIIFFSIDSFFPTPSPLSLTPSPLLPNFLFTPRARLYLPAHSLTCLIKGKETAAPQAKLILRESID